jgi:transposase
LPAQIKRETGEHYSYIERTLERYKETGGVEDRPRSGRPKIDLERPDLLRLKKKKTGSTRRLAMTLSAEQKEKVSKNAVWRRGKEMGMHSKVRPKKPMLTGTNAKARFEFANQARPRGYWKRVVAVNEKTFPLYSDMRLEWCEKGEKPSYRETVKWPRRLEGLGRVLLGGQDENFLHSSKIRQGLCKVPFQEGHSQSHLPVPEEDPPTHPPSRWRRISHCQNSEKIDLRITHQVD